MTTKNLPSLYDRLGGVYGAAGCRFAASAGITEAAMRPLNAAAISGRNTNDVSVICTVPAKIRWGEYGDIRYLIVTLPSLCICLISDLP
jgi:hypothetical protein